MATVPWEITHSVETNASPAFAWHFWTNVANWDDPPAKFELDGPFATGSRGVTRLPGEPMGDAKVEEAVVAVFAAIGNLKQHTAKDQIFDALPARAVNSVTAALGANVRMMTKREFVHGKLLDRGELYYNFSFRKRKRIVLTSV